MHDGGCSPSKADVYMTSKHDPTASAFRRHFVQTSAEDEKSQIQIFLNSVPLLASLDAQDKAMLVDAFAEEQYAGKCTTTCGCSFRASRSWPGH